MQPVDRGQHLGRPEWEVLRIVGNNLGSREEAGYIRTPGCMPHFGMFENRVGTSRARWYVRLMVAEQ